MSKKRARQKLLRSKNLNQSPFNKYLMETLQQDFLDEAIIQLEKLNEELNLIPIVSGNDVILSEIFRRVHSIKGSSQIFDLKIPANLAHRLETLLQDARNNKVSSGLDLKAILSDGLQNLRNILGNIKDGKKVSAPNEYITKLNVILNSLDKIEAEPGLGSDPLTSGLTEQEKTSLSAALSTGQQFFLIEAFFLPDNLELLKALRESLASRGEIIAVSSAANKLPPQIGFRIYYVSNENITALENALIEFEAQIVYPETQIDISHSPDINGALAQIVSSGKKAASAIGKEVLFEIGEPVPQVKGKSLKSVNEILLHLVRNAIDHAIETPNERIAIGKKSHGTIKINFFDEDEGTLMLSFEDDGRGIDLDKVRDRAITESGSGINSGLNRESLLDLIFTHGFTTRENVSDYSGRGVGLDIVKQIIDRESGSVEVSTEPNKGTSFKILLPKPPAS